MSFCETVGSLAPAAVTKMASTGEKHRTGPSEEPEAKKPRPADAGDSVLESAANYEGVFDGCLGFGLKSALIVVDFTKAYTTPGSKWYCPGKHFGVVDAIAESKPVLDIARRKGVPIFYTTVYFEHATDGGIFTQKIPLLRTWTKDNVLCDIDDSIRPKTTDGFIVKHYPSAFHGTNLASSLWAIGVDTCIVIGCSTSGCIRATVLEGMQLGFRCIVPRECVGDRTESIHNSNLFDMHAKNGDVVAKQVVMDHLNAMSDVDRHVEAEDKELGIGKGTFVAEQPAVVTTADNKANYKGLFDGGLGFGQKSALIVVDFMKAYTSPESKLYCPGAGFGVVDAVAESKPLLDLARRKRMPIFYTKVQYEHETDGGVFTQKIPLLRTLTPDNPLVGIDESIKPQRSDVLIIKQYPSAFFGTNLACNLRAAGVDTCIVIGCSTSGCIRATVLDGMQQGFRCIVPRECVGDRIESIHESNLFDMNAKNGDVVAKQVVLDYIATLP